MSEKPDLSPLSDAAKNVDSILGSAPGRVKVGGGLDPDGATVAIGVETKHLQAAAWWRRQWNRARAWGASVTASWGG